MDRNGLKETLVLMVLLFGLEFPCFTQTTDWGGIQIKKAQGRWTVWLENSLIKVGYHDAPWGCDCIGTFIHKETNIDVALNIDYRYNPNDYGFQRMDSAFIWEESPEHLSVYMKFLADNSMKGYHRKQIVSIYKGQSYIRVHYVTNGHTYDGLGEVQGEHKYVIYGAEKWAQLNEWKDPYGRHNSTHMFYHREWKKPSDVLVYRYGYGIFGMYKPDVGSGLGVLVDISKVEWFQLNEGKGFERSMDQDNHSVFYYPVKQGGKEIISFGKLIMDRIFGDTATGKPRLVSLDSAVAVVGHGFGYKVQYENIPFNTKPVLRYLTKPVWMSTMGDSVWGKPTAVGTETLCVVLRVNDVDCDTLRVRIVVVPSSGVVFQRTSATVQFSINGFSGLNVYDILGRRIRKYVPLMEPLSATSTPHKTASSAAFALESNQWQTKRKFVITP